MSVTDPIADMITRIRNAHQALHADVKIPVSRVKADIAKILKDEGFIEDYEVTERDIGIKLKYANGKPLITGIVRMSAPGRRQYVGAGEIPSVRNGLGICILSTSKGIMDGQKARAENVGGELLCELW